MEYVLKKMVLLLHIKHINCVFLQLITIATINSFATAGSYSKVPF